jgi:hypothetical protein
MGRMTNNQDATWSAHLPFRNTTKRDTGWMSAQARTCVAAAGKKHALADSLVTLPHRTCAAGVGAQRIGI